MGGSTSCCVLRGYWTYSYRCLCFDYRCSDKIDIIIEPIAIRTATPEIIVETIHLVFSEAGNFSLGFSWRSSLPFSSIRPLLHAFVQINFTRPSAAKDSSAAASGELGPTKKGSWGVAFDTPIKTIFWSLDRWVIGLAKRSSSILWRASLSWERTSSLMSYSIVWKVREALTRARAVIEDIGMSLGAKAGLKDTRRTLSA